MSKEMFTFEKCLVCHKPINNEANVKVLRRIILGSGLAGLAVGAIALPALGFGLSGITAGSFAASIQGPAVVAGSAFAVLQSLGATGLGIVLFGSLGGAVGALAPLTAKLGWCDSSCGETTELVNLPIKQDTGESNQLTNKEQLAPGEPGWDESDLNGDTSGIVLT
jgi:hypothetical protein